MLVGHATSLDKSKQYFKTDAKVVQLGVHHYLGDSMFPGDLLDWLDDFV